MAQTKPFMIGAAARCTDGPCGTVCRVVVDPLARAVTHLVVEPEHRQGLGRLVPLDLIDTAKGDVQLRCTLEEFERLDAAEETRFVPGAGASGDYDPEQVIAWPYYSLGGPGVAGDVLAGIPMAVTYDTVPLDEVEVRRGEHVFATDGKIGRVHGLVIEPDSHHVTHFLLQEGHLWGRKEVAIPIGAVTGMDDEGIRLSITKRQVQDLPPVDVDDPGQGSG